MLAPARARGLGSWSRSTLDPRTSKDEREREAQVTRPSPRAACTRRHVVSQFRRAGSAGVVGRLCVRLGTDDVEGLVELHVELGAVGSGDLDLVVALLVIDLGAGDSAAARVLECDCGRVYERAAVTSAGVTRPAGSGRGQHSRSASKAVAPHVGGEGVFPADVGARGGFSLVQPSVVLSASFGSLGLAAGPPSHSTPVWASSPSTQSTPSASSAFSFGSGVSSAPGTSGVVWSPCSTLSVSVALVGSGVFADAGACTAGGVVAPEVEAIATAVPSPPNARSTAPAPMSLSFIFIAGSSWSWGPQPPLTGLGRR